MRKIKGYLTVEAAFIVPIVIFCITFLLYIFFYQYDLIRIRGEVDEVLFQSNMSTKSIEEEELSKKIKYNLDHEMFYAKINYIDVTRNHSKYVVKVEIKNECPWFAGRTMFGLDEIYTMIVAKGMEHNPNEFIVRVDVLMDMLSEVKGISKYIE